MAHPGPATATSRRVCLTLVLCWAVPSTAGWSWAAFGSPLPVRTWYYALPSWVSLAAYLGAFALLLLWGILPVLLLAVGFDYVRASRPLGWRWRAAWAGVAAAGAALEVLPFAFPFSFMSVTPNLHEFAESLGFAAAGAAMILMLLGPREPGPSQAT